jgi:hypothetical protein
LNWIPRKRSFTSYLFTSFRLNFPPIKARIQAIFLSHVHRRVKIRPRRSAYPSIRVDGASAPDDNGKGGQLGIAFWALAQLLPSPLYAVATITLVAVFSIGLVSINPASA